MHDEISILAEEVGRVLKERQLVLAVAESCTGGGVGEAVTRIAGSSAWFDRGFITYTDAAKRELLGVPGETLERHGAVSEETARAMARGALERSDASLSIAVTGIAGPDGGSVDKPVGLVWFAWGTADGAIHAERRIFGGEREAVRAQSVAYALRGVLERLRLSGT
ncbi:MAG: CinA family protein [Bacillota bacterium]